MVMVSAAAGRRCSPALPAQDNSHQARQEFKETLKKQMMPDCSSSARNALIAGVGKLKAAHQAASKLIKRGREEEGPVRTRGEHFPRRSLIQ